MCVAMAFEGSEVFDRLIQEKAKSDLALGRLARQALGAPPGSGTAHRSVKGRAAPNTAMPSGIARMCNTAMGARARRRKCRIGDELQGRGRGQLSPDRPRPWARLSLLAGHPLRTRDAHCRQHEREVTDSPSPCQSSGLSDVGVLEVLPSQRRPAPGISVAF
jgi:hypothetical protein